jgi:DNA-binding CsgD family transcriptional regulator
MLSTRWRAGDAAPAGRPGRRGVVCHDEEVTGTRTPLAEEDSEEVRELRTSAEMVRDDLAEASAVGVEGLRRLVGESQIVEELAVLQPRARRSVWDMRPRTSFDPADPRFALDEASQAGGLDTVLVTRPHTLTVNPLLPSIYPTARIGPVYLQAIVLDQSVVVVEGPDTVDGHPTAWATDRRDFVVPVLEVWRRTVSMSRPLLGAGEVPALTPRQVQVACMLALGEKDQTIARRLSLSGRTVERDVRVVLEVLGARGRTEAVLLMRGRGLAGPPSAPSARTDPPSAHG